MCKELGLYTCDAIEDMRQEENIECVECIEGCLFDSLLLYDNNADIYYMCLECAANEWCSYYRVYRGAKDIIWSKWNEFKTAVEAA